MASRFGSQAKPMHPCFAPGSESFRSPSKPLLLFVLTAIARRVELPLNLVGLRPGTNPRALRFNALASGRHCAGAQSLLPWRLAGCAVASNRARRASGTDVAFQQALPAAAGFGFWWHAGSLPSYWGQTPVPNPSLKRRANGVALGPRATVPHHASRGPSTTPPAPA